MPGETILIVDDDPLMLECVKLLLQGEGYDILSAGTVAEAMALAKQKPPHMLITDISLPDGQGSEIAAGMEGDFTAIALTGFSPDTFAPGTAEVFDHVLVKPVDFDRMLELVRRCFAPQSG
jgi:DNA-binding NtrC family response regulator